MTGPRSPRSASPRKRQLAARLLDGNSLALGTLLAAMLAADASALVRIADLPIGVANGLGNTGNFNGNGNAGNFNGNANCGNGFGNGSASDGNGNGQGTGGTPDWCRFLKDLNGRLGLPPGTIPDFTLK
ncbi:hypothetical protein [Mesorhizobium sp. M4B.F.Ca.ET.089.01.1.1]|uniref:hypothetical protein n=1 Tax=Mesorhizobium sp. M4B.F.Ca.ET.089.01.1.1 TaxID=2496662 RepID=UPI0016795B5D|nr:hypothetical protein [Mesorhizobium sp. M4B.F.Ca.ET.089.01.1.1]